MLLLAGILAIIIHELGHVIALRYFGYKSKVIFRKKWLSPIAVQAVMPDSGREFITAAIAGPFAALVFGLAILPFDLLIAAWVIFFGTILQLSPWFPGSDGWQIQQALRRDRNA